jgi:hypothetical protein
MQEKIWAPILNTPGNVTLCVGDWNRVTSDPDWAKELEEMVSTHKIPFRAEEFRASDPTPYVENMVAHHTGAPAISYVDSSVASTVSAWLASRRKRTRMLVDSDINYDHFRNGPVVSIGALDNPWYMVLLSNLRYRYRFDKQAKEIYVEDAQNLNSREYKISADQSFYYSNSTTDYAIISRVYNADTGNWILGIAGMGLHGTEAAGELLTDPEFNSSLPPDLLNGKKNVQILLKTAVINGHSGTPRILGYYAW